MSGAQEIERLEHAIQRILLRAEAAEAGLAAKDAQIEEAWREFRELSQRGGDAVSAKEAEVTALKQVIGVVTPCARCDGSGWKEPQGACCRIPGHARQCQCAVCEWMRSSYSYENQYTAANREVAALKAETEKLRRNMDFDRDRLLTEILAHDQTKERACREVVALKVALVAKDDAALLEISALKREIAERDARVAPKDRELSAYAFTSYGNDARLYNGIHDLETEVAALREKLEAAQKDTERVQAIEEWAESGVLTIGGEFDDGVFVDVDLIGKDSRSYRGQKDVRTGLDAARSKGSTKGGA